MVRVWQMLTLTIGTFLILGVTSKYINSNVNDVYNNVGSGDVFLQFGRAVEAMEDLKYDDMDLIITDNNLKMNKSTNSRYSIVGDSVQKTKDCLYINEFVDIFRICDGTKEVYKTQLDEDILEIVMQDIISIKEVYNDDEVYQALAHINLQSTIGYYIDASVLTTINEGVRSDILINEDIMTYAYDEENDLYYLFFVATNNSQYLENNRDVSKLSYYILRNSDDGYVLDDELYSTNKVVRSDNIYKAIIKDDGYVDVYYNVSNKVGNDMVYDFYVAHVNLEEPKETQASFFAAKSLPDDKPFSVDATMMIKDDFYIFYSDLSYTKINVYDYVSDTYIIEGTKKVENFEVDNDGEDIWLVSQNRGEIKLLKIQNGKIVEEHQQDRLALGFGIIDFSVLYDIAINKK